MARAPIDPTAPKKPRKAAKPKSTYILHPKGAKPSLVTRDTDAVIQALTENPDLEVSKFDAIA